MKYLFAGDYCGSKLRFASVAIVEWEVPSPFPMWHSARCSFGPSFNGNDINFHVFLIFGPAERQRREMRRKKNDKFQFELLLLA